MQLNYKEINFSKYDSMEELCKELEHKFQITDETDKSVFRWQIIHYWIKEYNQITTEDADFIRQCGFDVENFETKEEWQQRADELLNNNKQYKSSVRKQEASRENYVKETMRNAKKEYKKIIKEQGKRYSSVEYRAYLQQIHEKNAELQTLITKTVLRMERNWKRRDLDLDRDEDNTVMHHLSKESITKEIMRYEKDLPFLEEEITAAAEYYLKYGEDAKLSITMSDGEFIEKTDAFIERNKKAILTLSMLGLVIFNVILLAIRYITCFARLDRIVVSNNGIYITLSILLSAVAWVYMTTQDYFNYRNRKWELLIIVIINDFASILQLLYTSIWDIFVVRIFRIQINDLFTDSMVISLARLIVVIIMAIGVAVCWRTAAPFLSADEMKESILSFKLSHIVDTRENKEYLYDFVAVKDLNTGKVITIKEHDLFMHLLMIGASGTGKTSSIYIPQVIEYIRRKMKNLDMQQKEVLRMLQMGEVKIIEPFSHNKFGKQYFRATSSKSQAKLDAIFKKYRECGITVMAPNNSMNEDILNYTSNRGIWVNNLDPSKKQATHPYERLVGLNPFYTPPQFYDIPPADNDAEEERTIFIAEAANNFADCLTAINELNGAGDQYFTDVNTTVTSAIVTIVMLDASIRNVRATIDDVYNCIINFSMLQPKVNNIKNHFNIKYINNDDKEKKPRKDINKILPGINADSEEEQERLEKERAREAYSELTESDKENPYIQTIITVETRLQKGSKMDEHAEGLRNLIGRLLQDPRVKRVLVTNKDIIDFNEILSENAITLVNTALDFGSNTSTCFGQLFQLSFNSAVLRRPRDKRTPHFFFQDETARYLAETHDTMVTLYRQFGVACFFALQSLSQTEKVSKLAFLHQTFLSVGAIISFGRAGNEDAETISKLSGKKRYDMVQKTYSHTSVFSADAHSSFSERTTPDEKEYMSPTDIRYRDFQECTIIACDNGRVVPAKAAKANFVPKQLLENKELAQIEYHKKWAIVWQGYYPRIEDIMMVNADTTIPSEATVAMTNELRENTPEIRWEKQENEPFPINTDISTTMESLLNNRRIKYCELAEPVFEEEDAEQESNPQTKRECLGKEEKSTKKDTQIEFDEEDEEEGEDEEISLVDTDTGLSFHIQQIQQIKEIKKEPIRPARKQEDISNQSESPTSEISTEEMRKKIALWKENAKRMD